MPLTDAIERKLRATLSPEHLEVVNESGAHNVPAGSESHFRVVIASERFAGLSAVARHRLVYRALAEELAGGVHALALHAYSPEQWRALGAAPASPPCRGGMAPQAPRE